MKQASIRGSMTRVGWGAERLKHLPWIGKVLLVIAAFCLMDGVGAVVVPTLPGWLGFEYFASHPAQYALFEFTQAAFWFSLALLFGRFCRNTR